MVTIQDLVKRSHAAQCGVMEREVTVSTSIKAQAISKIKESGYQFIGSGPAGFGKTKLWFIRRGGF